MDTMTITRNGISLTIDRRTDQYGTNRVVATNGVDQAIGQVDGIRSQVYPRIRLSLFNDSSRRLAASADHRGHYLGDYETDTECMARPLDWATFDLTPDEVTTIQAWRCPAPERWQPPATSTPQPIEPIFAIGGLNLGDGAETQTPWPVSGRICRICGQAESHGAMFTTIAGGNVCDDCL